ncbi:MAG: hypothetical protein ACREV9_17630 [Burkholderiales bacterium]
MTTNRRPLIQTRLDPVSQRHLVEAVLVEARRARAKTIRDLLVQAAGFIYRTIMGAAQIVRKIIAGGVQGFGHRTGKPFTCT